MQAQREPERTPGPPAPRGPDTAVPPVDTQLGRHHRGDRPSRRRSPLIWVTPRCRLGLSTRIEMLTLTGCTCCDGAHSGRRKALRRSRLALLRLQQAFPGRSRCFRGGCSRLAPVLRGLVPASRRPLRASGAAAAPGRPARRAPWRLLDRSRGGFGQFLHDFEHGGGLARRSGIGQIKGNIDERRCIRHCHGHRRGRVRPRRRTARRCSSAEHRQRDSPRRRTRIRTAPTCEIPMRQ